MSARVEHRVPPIRSSRLEVLRTGATLEARTCSGRRGRDCDRLRHPAGGSEPAEVSGIARPCHRRPGSPPSRDATACGPVPSSQQIVGAVAMKPRDAEALQAFATAVSTPGSSTYHRFITPAGFADRFGPTRASIAAVSAQLRADGLRVGPVSANGLLINFGGSAARVSAAFHTGLARFRLADGSVGTGTTSAVRLPPAIAGSVATVVGLDNLVRPHPMSLLRGGLRAGRPAAKAPAVARIAGAPNACRRRAVGGRRIRRPDRRSDRRLVRARRPLQRRRPRLGQIRRHIRARALLTG